MSLSRSTASVRQEHPAARAPRRRPVPVPAPVASDVDAATELLARGGVALGLAAIALIHFLDLFSKLDETPYLGVAYIVLIGAALVMAARLVRGAGRRWWVAAAALAGMTMAGYALSRSVGLPASTVDIGNWEEPLGLASLFVEAVVVALSLYALGVVGKQAPAAIASDGSAR